ncbi:MULTISPECIES: hypothetical protein [unclassified Streptomyces]
MDEEAARLLWLALLHTARPFGLTRRFLRAPAPRWPSPPATK